jgi:hypothetical protein
MFDKFRDQGDDETNAAYFRNAISKAAKQAGVTCESTVQGFVSAAITWAKDDKFMLNKAYDYAVKQMGNKDLRLSTQDLMADA